jgi:predicted RNase H-like nuclease (RuvC/YqgF family)
VTLGTAFLTYVVGRSSRSSEVKHLEKEKKDLEANNVSEHSEVISNSSATMIQPLFDRIREQQEEIKFLIGRNLDYRNEIKRLDDEIEELKRKVTKE